MTGQSTKLLTLLVYLTISILAVSYSEGAMEQKNNQSGSTDFTNEGLKTEYLTNPIGIDCISPRLSWYVESCQRGQYQSAYHILVASSLELLNSDTGDLWDTGKIESDNTLHIEYQGKTLQSYQRCFWKVKVWDKNKTPSSWSQPASWSMGILSEKEWAGKWLGYTKITNNKTEATKWKQEASSPLFRKTFSAKKEISYASLHICGLGFYEAYINGEKVGDHVLDPAFTRYDRSCLYVSYDITSMLKQGSNAIGVMLGNGWYNVFTDAAWDFNEAPWRDKPKMLSQLRIEYTDGSTELIVSDSSWKANTGPVVQDGIRQGESYDARREIPGWSNADFDDLGWENPDIVQAPKGSLRAQMITPIKVTETITPAILTEPKPGVFVYDLGQNIAGWAQLKVSGPKGTKVQIRYAERLNNDGTIDQDDIKRHTYEDTFQTDTYTLKGEGTETWEPRFAYYGFQYIEVTGFPGTPNLDSISGRVVHTTFENSAQFECSNQLLNKIQNCTLWAYRGNFHGYPTDCPHREKNGWTGDAHLAAEQAMYNWANGAGYTKWLMDLYDEQKETGELPGIVPTGGWGYSWGNGPAWDSAYLIIPWYMYQYYGDTAILAKHYDRFTRYVDYLSSKAEDNIVSIGLGDWAPAKTKTPEAVTSTVYYYIDAMITAQTAEILGKSDDAIKYYKLAANIKQSFNQAFYKGEGIYDAGSQTALCFPLYYDLTPEKDRGKVLGKLVKNIESRDYHIDTGILGAKAIYNVLAENGAFDTAYKMLTQTTPPSYGHWIKLNATTLWEQWSGTDSRNHIMFGDISAWLYKNLAGITLDINSPENIAFKHILIRPRITKDLQYVKANYKSIRGNIKSEWHIKGNTCELNVEIPANTTATIYIPTSDSSSIKESDNKTLDMHNIKFINYANGYAVYEVQSGQYNFSSEI